MDAGESSPSLSLPLPSHNHLTPPLGFSTETCFAPPSSTVTTGREYTIPSPLRRFLAETVDFFILFCVKATIVLWIMHLSGMKDISKFMMQFIVEEIDENTSLEDLQKMMVVALAYRVLVCVYEIICIWGAGGATPGKFLLGLRVVTCDSTVLVQPNRVLVVPATSVSLSAHATQTQGDRYCCFAPGQVPTMGPQQALYLVYPHERLCVNVGIDDPSMGCCAPLAS
ncbi:FAM8A1-like protein [Labeo rohita]|uniref:FAM8A1-like protein n=1 Tax=Labeo rohita TaxID=84645 RepID=A0A498N6D2_LABRO|nr:FAM8A1-like protein [Labeo rohita]